MAAGKAIKALGKEVVEYIDRLLTKQTKNFETNNLKFDEDLDLTKNFRPDPETLDYHVDEIGEQINAFLQQPPQDVMRSTHFFDPNAIQRLAMSSKKNDYLDGMQESHMAMVTPKTHRLLNTPLYSDNPEELKRIYPDLDPDLVDEEAATSLNKIKYFEELFKNKQVPKGTHIFEDSKGTPYKDYVKKEYQGVPETPLIVVKRAPDGSLRVVGHESRHRERALENLGLGDQRYLTEIQNLSADEVNLRDLPPDTPVYNDTGIRNYDGPAPEKIGTLGDLLKIIYGVAPVAGALPAVERYIDQQTTITP
jgi:hypothetical protein